MIYLQLFLLFLKVGFLGFGGGMALISLIQQDVLRFGWMTETEFVDIVAISQITPGPIGMNCATYVGYTVTNSVWGALLASSAIVLPSLLIMGILCYVYDKIREKWQENRVFKVVMRIIRILVVILIGSAAYSLMTPASFVDGRSWVIFALVFIASLLGYIKWEQDPWKTVMDWVSHPIVLLLLAGMAGVIIYL